MTITPFLRRRPTLPAQCRPGPSAPSRVEGLRVYGYEARPHWGVVIGLIVGGAAVLLYNRRRRYYHEGCAVRTCLRRRAGGGTRYVQSVGARDSLQIASRGATSPPGHTGCK